MDKLDLRKQYKTLYQPSAKKVELVDVPPLNFAMVDGHIEPGSSPGESPAFQKALGALYGIAYTLKFMSKLDKVNPLDYSVMGLEALWWFDQGELDLRKPDNWAWRAMILQPDHISPEMFAEGKAQLARKKPDLPLDELRLECYHEGLCVQIMHIGPYADEPATVAKMDAFATQNGFRMHGLHHEIYLGNPLRGDQAKLKTVLRHPVERIPGK